MIVNGNPSVQVNVALKIIQQIFVKGALYVSELSKFSKLIAIFVRQFPSSGT